MKQFQLGDILRVTIIKDEVFIAVELYDGTKAMVSIGWMYHAPDEEVKEEVFVEFNRPVVYHANGNDTMYFILATN